jgi:hypothetical protein
VVKALLLYFNIFFPQQDSALNTSVFLLSFLFLYRPSKEGVVAII